MHRFAASLVLLLALSACGEKIDPLQPSTDVVEDIPPDGISWCRHIEPMMKNFCTDCHASSLAGPARNGAPASSNFDTYASTFARADAAQKKMTDGLMPPPPARIFTADKKLFGEWISTGRRECDPVVSEDITIDVPTVDHSVVSDLPNPTDTSVDLTCTSGTFWTESAGNGELMRPGADCVTCHSTSSLPFAAAGTVMGGLHDQDNCTGIDRVAVSIKGSGANPVIVVKVSNPSGNFYWESNELRQITPPFTARISANGTVREMTSPQSNFNFTACHTAAGKFGAPGRISIQ